MSNERADVVIVGAGIAGCIVALILGLEGREVLVVERAREVGRVGPDFIKPRGIEALRRLGLLPELYRRGAIERSVIQYFHDGAPLLRYDFAEHTATGHYLIVPYGALLSAVVERLSALGVKMWFSATVRALEPAPGGRTRVTLADGRSATAEAVIGADGTSSIVRELSGIQASRQSYEQVMFLATLPLVPSVAECNRLYLSSQRWAAYFYPISGEQMRVTSVVPAAESASFPSEPGWAVERLRRFVSESDDVLEAIRDPGAFQGVPLGRMHASAYHRGNVALVGNSLLEVHPMTGQGMSLAFEDAAELGGRLSSFFRGEASLDEALTQYAAQRRPINTSILEYGDRLYRSFPSRERYLESFDPRAHGELR